MYTEGYVHPNFNLPPYAGIIRIRCSSKIKGERPGASGILLYLFGVYLLASQMGIISACFCVCIHKQGTPY